MHRHETPPVGVNHADDVGENDFKHTTQTTSR
jgi:hypothetical protein